MESYWNGFKSITRSESLGQKAVFNTIFSILKFLQTPFDNEALVTAYETLSENGFYKPRLQLEIRSSEKPFITKDGDEIESGDLAQFLWDMQYWLNCSTIPLEELVIKIGLFYYTSDIEKSNVYLIGTLVRKLNNNSNFNLTLERLDALAKRPNLSGFKFFSEEEDENAIKGKVQIMTLHKSKGDEFEYVFMPELSEKMLNLDVNCSNLKTSTAFMEEVRGFNPKYKIKSELELKEFSAEESMRLFYVAVTRAKKKLIIIIIAEPIIVIDLTASYILFAASCQYLLFSLRNSIVPMWSLNSSISAASPLSLIFIFVKYKKQSESEYRIVFLFWDMVSFSKTASE